MIKTNGSTIVNRRDVLALGTSAAALAVTGRQAAAAQPKKGGTLRVGLTSSGTSDSLDPATWSSSIMQVGFTGGVYNCLTEVSETGELTPELAESWEASSEGASTWIFNLRKGVEFHNGKTLDAEDVIASINYHRDENSKSAAKGIVSAIADIKADGKDKIVFKLVGPNADFPFLLSDYHLVITPSVDGKPNWQSAVGTGGYVVVTNDPGVRVTLKRQPNYWKSGRAHFDEAQLIAIGDVAARQNALVTGEVDVINKVDLRSLQILKRDDIVIEEVTGTQHYSMPMNTKLAPFDNNDVRLALKYAIDREALVNLLLRGHGRVANDHPISPSNRFFAKDLPQRVYDPEKARFHLKKAGVDTLKLSLSAANAAFAGAIDAATLFHEQAAKAGITIEVVTEPDDAYWSNVWMKKPFVVSYWGGRPTEDWMFSQVYASNSKWNESFWSNATFDKLLLEARAELDDNKRRDLYVQMQGIVRDEGGSIIPMYANYVDARSTRVTHGEKIASNWELDGRKLLERWWAA